MSSQNQDIVNQADASERNQPKVPGSARGQNVAGSNDQAQQATQQAQEQYEWFRRNEQPQGESRNGQVEPTTSGRSGETETTPLLHRNGESGRTGHRRIIEIFKLDQSYWRTVFKVLLYVFLLFEIIWLVLLFMNLAFSFTIPGLNFSPGSGFLEFDFTILTLLNVVFTLTFFDAQTYGDLILDDASIILLLIDLVFLMAVPTLRHRHSTAVGLVTLIIAIVVYISVSVIHYFTLSWQHRLRDEFDIDPRELESQTVLIRLFKTSLSFTLRFVFTAIILLISITILVRAFFDIKEKRPGVLVPVADGRYNVHVYCDPLSRPEKYENLTVLVESSYGSAQDFSSWLIDLQNEQKIGRVCYWDRPGYGYSDSVSSPFSIGSAVDVLSSSLNDSPDTKYMLVSHGVGGLYSRVFAARHSSQIHSVVLIDTLHEEDFLHRAGLLKKLWYFAQGILGPVFPSKFRYSSYSRARLQELQSTRTGYNEVKFSNLVLPSSMPVAVVTSSESIEKHHNWDERQRQLTKLTDNNVAWKILDGPHELWKDQSCREQLQDLVVKMTEYLT
jgi:pimeloyl-ACP methyl ester carboxylesterase